jgi:hypothetical protein
MSEKVQLIVVNHQITRAFDEVHHFEENLIGKPRRKGRAEVASCHFEARKPSLTRRAESVPPAQSA